MIILNVYYNLTHVSVHNQNNKNNFNLILYYLIKNSYIYINNWFCEGIYYKLDVVVVYTNQIFNTYDFAHGGQQTT